MRGDQISVLSIVLGLPFSFLPLTRKIENWTDVVEFKTYQKSLAFVYG